MSEDHQENLRDLAAMFALNALVSKHTWLELRSSETKDALGIEAYELADALLNAKGMVSVGIASAKRKRK
jgi:hypothetical protein